LRSRNRASRYRGRAWNLNSGPRHGRRTCRLRDIRLMQSRFRHSNFRVGHDLRRQRRKQLRT
jgi:hypothetical protein